MKKVLLIHPQFKEALTGGLVYDFYLFEKFKTCNSLNLFFLDDRSIKFENKNSFLYNVKYISKLLHDFDFDYVITNSRLYPRFILFFPVLKLLKRKVKIITIHHHFNFMTHKGIMRYIHGIFELLVLKLSDELIVPSPYIKEIVESKITNVKCNYIEIAFNKKHTISKQLLINKKVNNTLLFVGTIEERKGVVDLIKMVRKLKSKNINVVMNIVGKYNNDKYYNYLNKLVFEYGLEEYIYFWGRIDSDRLNNMYLESSVFVFPSRHEGYGMVLAEAMGYGLPVVAYDNSAIPFTIKNNENGFLICNLQVEQFTTKVSEILLNEDLYNTLKIGAFTSYLNLRSFEMLDHDIESFINDLILN